jgi:hypothetical protein
VSNIEYDEQMVAAFLEPRAQENVPAQYAHDLAHMAYDTRIRLTEREAELGALRAVVDGVRALHHPSWADEQICDNCRGSATEYLPCPTLAVLDGGAKGNVRQSSDDVKADQDELVSQRDELEKLKSAYQTAYNVANWALGDGRFLAELGTLSAGRVSALYDRLAASDRSFIASLDNLEAKLRESDD